MKVSRPSNLREWCDPVVRGDVRIGTRSKQDFHHLSAIGVGSDPQGCVPLSITRVHGRTGGDESSYQGDLATGTESFRTPLARGLEILEQLRGRVGGLAIPRLILDLPNGGGKVSLTPDRLVSTTAQEHTFRAPLGGTRTYTDVTAPDCACSTTDAVAARYGL